MKLVPFILIIGEVSKQYKDMPQRVFHQITKALGGFQAWTVCSQLWALTAFLVDSYNEPHIPIRNHYSGS